MWRNEPDWQLLKPVRVKTELLMNITAVIVLQKLSMFGAIRIASTELAGLPD